MKKSKKSKRLAMTNVYELVMLLDDLLLYENDEDKAEKLRLIRRRISRFGNIELQSDSKEK